MEVYHKVRQASLTKRIRGERFRNLIALVIVAVVFLLAAIAA